MRFCEAPEKCVYPVFSTDKITKKGYCKSHAVKYRTDIDRRTILKRAMDKQKGLENKVRGLMDTDANVEVAIRNSELKEWFAYHMEHSKRRCENCSQSLEHYSLKYWRNSQHHIIEKRLCPSVQTELLNHCVLGMFCCHQQVHTSYANVIKMPVFPLLKARFELFKDKVADSERYKIPECFLI